MSYLHQHIQFVKEQVEFQERMIKRYPGDTYRQTLHARTQARFAALAEDMERADRTLDEIASQPSPQLPLPLDASKPIRLGLMPKELEGLPDEVLKELSLSDGDKTEFAVLGLIDEAGGITSLDRLIIGLFRKTGEAHKRQNLVSKLYRMAQKEMIYNVPTKKGVYSTRPISEDEAARLFGGETADI